MTDNCGIVVDLDGCVGCYACELACKMENDVPLGTKWIKVVALGPKKLDGKYEMLFVPTITGECALCKHRIDKNQEPVCVENCPTQAMHFCKDSTELLDLYQNQKSFHICKLTGDTPAFG